MQRVKIWVDDIRPAPEGYLRVFSVNEAINMISTAEKQGSTIDLIDLDHDAGDYFVDGGDYIKVLDWLEETHRDYPIRLHSMNPVGVQNMRAIIKKNNWREIR